MEEMTISHFLEKYNKLLILIKSNYEEEEENELQQSETNYFKKPNNFNIEKNVNMPDLDYVIENININNIRDLIKNRKDFNNNFNIKENNDFRIDNNHSDILINIDKLSFNNEDISIDGDLLNEINFTESAASTYREKFDRRIGSIIKPTNTFNNRFTNDIEYQLDLEKAKRRQRNKEGSNINNFITNKIISTDNTKNSSFFKGKNMLKIIDNNLFQSKNDLLVVASNKNLKQKGCNLIPNLDKGIQEEGFNEIFDIDESNNNINNIKINSEVEIDKNFVIEKDNSKPLNNININFTNYGVMNNNLINYDYPKTNSLNSKMLDIFKELNSIKPKASFNLKNNFENLDNQTKKIDSKDINKYIIESNSENNFDNMVMPKKDLYNIDIKNNPFNNTRNLNNANKIPFGSSNNLNIINKQDFLSEKLKNFENKCNIKSLSDRINEIKNKNLFTGSNIKGVNNTNTLINLNSKLSNLDKIIKNNTYNRYNLNSQFDLNNNITSLKNRVNQNYNAPLFNKIPTKTGILQLENGQFNQNNFDILEAQLDSLKKKTTKTKHKINKLNNLIINDNVNLNLLNNIEDRINYEKINQSIEESENLVRNLKESNNDKNINIDFKQNFLSDSYFDSENI